MLAESRGLRIQTWQNIDGGETYIDECLWYKAADENAIV